MNKYNAIDIVSISTFLMAYYLQFTGKLRNQQHKHKTLANYQKSFITICQCKIQCNCGGLKSYDKHKEKQSDCHCSVLVNNIVARS